jgi:hypothetical protein
VAINPLNHQQASWSTSPAGAGLHFHIAQPVDVAALHAWYRTCTAWPFFTEIAGPTPMFNRSQFREYCSIDAQLMVGMEGGQLCAFILLTYIQNDSHVANLDFRWRDGYPEPDSAQAVAFTSALRLLCRRAGVTKTHLLSLPMEADRLRFAQGLGFVQEGVLAQHFFHHGRCHDLQCLGRSGDVGDARA